MPNIVYTKDFSSEAADLIAHLIRDSLKSNEFCVVCLAGGKTPISIYEKLSEMDLKWNRIYITFGDERNVAKTDKKSNYKAAHDSLISKVSIPESQVLCIETELGPEKAAESYGQNLLRLKEKLNQDYIFDIMLLGIGNDGHTASLFPETEALKVTNKLVVVNRVPQLNTERITLTYPAINSSKNIIFLVNDPSKKEILEKIWNGEDFPATHVRPTDGNTTWMVGR